MKVAVAMAHGHAAKWLQVAINSLKSTKNETPFDIYVAATWPNHESLKAITETDLGDGVNIITCQRRLHSHATGLDEILDVIAEKDYTHMFCMETDCRAVKDGWLDWYTSFVEDPSHGMAGFFWHEGDRHYNINPSGTIYRKDMLLKYHQEVRENKENMFWHPRGNKHGNDGGMDPTIKDVAGVFSETRGIKHPNHDQLDQILRGVPQAAWYEPGAYCYYRMLGEYGGVSVPVDHIYCTYGNHTAPEATYYGGKGDPYFIHYWGGTRAWDHLKHPVTDGFVKGCSPYWLDREDTIWRQFVPEKYHATVKAIYDKLGLEGMGYDRG